MARRPLPGRACVDNDGIDLDKPVRIRVTVEKTGDRILFDFSECSPQTTGPANIRPPLVRACCYYCLIALIDPFLPINQGLARVVETRFRQGTVVCPDYPAAGGRARDGKRSYVQYEIFAGGTGGRNGKDGASATSFHLSNGKIAPVEIIESEFPTQVELFELLRDSGGPGRHRGGLGFVREYRILQDEVRFSMRTDKHALAPQGIDGGQPGGTGDCVINPGREDERSLPSRFGDQRLKTGDVLRVERPGGGGVGVAFERSPEAVLDDVRQGYVSVERARSEYGVVVSNRGDGPDLDLEETLKLRGKPAVG